VVDHWHAPALAAMLIREFILAVLVVPNKPHFTKIQLALTGQNL
jgi:hypothetical protein